MKNWTRKFFKYIFRNPSDAPLHVIGLWTLSILHSIKWSLNWCSAPIGCMRSSSFLESTLSWGWSCELRSMKETMGTRLFPGRPEEPTRRSPLSDQQRVAIAWKPRPDDLARRQKEITSVIAAQDVPGSVSFSRCRSFIKSKLMPEFRLPRYIYILDVTGHGNYYHARSLWQPTDCFLNVLFKFNALVNCRHSRHSE